MHIFAAAIIKTHKMKDLRQQISAVLTVSAMILAGMTAYAQQPKALQVKQLTLSNGLTVWLNEDHSQPKVYGALVVKAGAKDCPNTGIAHYLEHVLFKGTQKIGTIDYAAEKVWLDSISLKYNELSQTKDEAQRQSIQQNISRLSQRAADYAIPNEFERLISKYGGSALNATTSYDVTEYHNTFSPQYLEQWCWLNSERMLNPVFRLFQGELETVYEEKNRAADNMLMPVIERLAAAAFKGHPYQYPIIGSTENLKNPRLSDMEDFFHRYYVAGNMGLMLCGDFQAEGIKPLLERTFGRLPKGEVVHEKPADLQPFHGETLSLKLNIPIMKAVGLLFRGPLETSPDFRPLQVAMRMLSNDNGTGMLDSLRTAHQVMMAISENFSMNEAGAVGLLVIPNVPFGSKKKAERLCWEQIERLKQGNFPEERMELAKQDLLREIEEATETITDRASLMGSIFSQGRSWDDFLAQAENVRSIKKADVMAVASRYLRSDQYLRGVKKFGSYPKERVSQPNYKPVVPKHAKAQSQYAKDMERMPVVDRSAKLIDLEHDAEITKDATFTLYCVDNPVNDLFTLSFKWHKGKRNDPRLALLENYLDELGTDSLTKHQLGEAWQRLGTTLTTQSSDNYVMLSLRGFEQQLEPSLRLLNHVLTSIKSDDKAMKELQKEYKINYKQRGRENSDVLQMLLVKIMRDNQSEYLKMPTVDEVKRMTGDDLLQLFTDVRQYPCDVLYSGKRSSEQVAALCRQYLPATNSQHPTPDNAIPLQEYQEPLVYIYDMPKARQTYIGIYGSIKPNLTEKEESQLRLWSQYMGGGMSSMLFQEIREFRSMAYSTGGWDITPNRARHRDYPSGYVAYLGTQGDKTMLALAVLDSLITQMPLDEQRVMTARQEIVNDINNNYPSYRQLPNFVSSYRMSGYTDDPRSDIARIVPTLTSSDMMDFYHQNIQQHPHVVFIVGDKRMLDMQKLATYGKIVELKKDDILRGR